MPANLPPDSKSKWLKVSQSKNSKDKIIALQEFLASIPKHKGNERLRGQIKSKIAALRVEINEKKTKKKSSMREVIPKEGAARILILGRANSGKSSLLKALTNAKPNIASYPYTTTHPIPGIMIYQDIRLQLIEVPSIPEVMDYHRAFNLIKSADELILLIDLSNKPEIQLSNLLKILDQANVSLIPIQSKIEIQRKSQDSIQMSISGRLLDCTADDIKRLLNEYGIKNGFIKAYGDVSLHDIEEAILKSKKYYKPILILGNKIDIASREISPPIRYLPKGIIIIPISCKTGKGLQEVPKGAFKNLNLIRAYTKNPGRHERTGEPFILKKGSTVRDLAKKIHNQLHENFKYAKIWGSSAKYHGEKVGDSHVLKDKDTVEIHTK